MRKSIGLLMCLSILAFCACKKKSSAPAVLTTRVAYVYDASSHLNTLYYYSPTYLIRGDYDDSGKYNYSYHYLDGISVVQATLNGSLAYSVSYIWNSQSLVDSSDQLDVNGNIIYRKKYTYNGSGYLTNVNWYNDVNTLVLSESFTISNGNITQHSYTAMDTASAGLPSGSYSYQYTSQPNTLSNLYFGQSYLGTSSANAVQSMSYTNGGTTTTTSYAYHYNSGLISSQIVFSDSTGGGARQIDSIAYLYYTD